MDLRIALSVTGRMISAVDEWRRMAPDIPPRSEAIRRLVGEGVASHYLRHRGDHLLAMLEKLHRDGRLTDEEWGAAQSISDSCMAQALRVAADVSGGDTDEASINPATLERKVTAEELRKAGERIAGISREALERPFEAEPKDEGPFVRSVRDEKPAPTYPKRPPKKLK